MKNYLQTDPKSQYEPLKLNDIHQWNIVEHFNWKVVIFEIFVFLEKIHGLLIFFSNCLRLASKL